MAKHLVTTLKRAIKDIDPKVWFGATYNDGGVFSRRVKMFTYTKTKDRQAGIHDPNLLKVAIMVATKEWYRENNLPMASVDVEMSPMYSIGSDAGYQVIVRIMSKDKQGNVVQPSPSIFTEDERDYIVHALDIVAADYWLDHKEELASSIRKKLASLTHS